MAIARQNLAIQLFLQAMLLLYVLGRLLQLYSAVIPTLTIVLFQAPAAFALIHGILMYRLRAFCSSLARAWVTDPSGQAWMVKSIIGGCVLSSLFVMGPFALLAWIRLTDQQEC